MIRETKMEELKNLFFYTFGIVPLQSYNVVGDGITDNRLSIQQAIYEAIDVGVKYIFVPKGNYYYSNQLFKTEEVIFVGNNVDTFIEGIEIRQFPDLWSEAQATTPALTPIGGVIIYAGQTIPTSYLECNGQTVNTKEYLSLYAILNNVDTSGMQTIPDIFNIPSLSTGNENTKYIMRAK